MGSPTTETDRENKTPVETRVHLYIRVSVLTKPTRKDVKS